MLAQRLLWGSRSAAKYSWSHSVPLPALVADRLASSGLDCRQWAARWLAAYYQVLSQALISS